MLRFLSFSFLSFAWLFGVVAQESEGVTLVRPALISEVSGIVPGKPFTVGLHLKMAPHCHTYWQYPGDSGMPTKIEWKLPPGFKTGDIQWPLPVKIDEEGDMRTYAYESEVLLLVQIIPPPDLSEREITIGATAKWLVCEQICVPGEAELALTLPVAEKSAIANEELFRKFRAQLPSKRPAPFALKWQKQSGSLQLTVEGLTANQAIEFFPLPPSGILIGHPTVRDTEVIVPVESGDAKSLPGVLVVQEGNARAGWQIGLEQVSANSAPGRGSLRHFLILGFIGGLF